jgi:hypothetical protein
MIYLISYLLTFIASYILFYSGVSSFRLEQWTLTYLSKYNLCPSLVLVYLQPGDLQSQIG